MPKKIDYELYKGVKVRHSNRIVLKVGIVMYKKIIDEVERTGLSIHKILAYSGKPCDKCKGSDVITYDKEDNVIKIKRGILSVPDSNGINIIQNSKNKNNKK